MTNITGLSELLVNDTDASKRKKRARQLTKLDTDDTEDDDSEEFQLSEYDSFS